MINNKRLLQQVTNSCYYDLKVACNGEFYTMVFLRTLNQ